MTDRRTKHIRLLHGCNKHGFHCASLKEKVLLKEVMREIEVCILVVFKFIS